MHIIVAGAGEVGWHIAQLLCADRHHSVTLIDRDESKIRQAEGMDIVSIRGEASNASLLQDAGADRCGMFVAFTSDDVGNLLAASVAKRLGAERAVARVHAAYFTDNWFPYDMHLGIDRLFCPEQLTAMELAAMVRNPGTLVVEHYGRGQIEMQQILVDSGASAEGNSLAKLQLPEGVRIGSVERGQSLIIPRGDDSLAENDLISLIGTPEAIAAAKPQFKKANPPRRTIVVLGGGTTGKKLSRLLQAEDYQVTIIEQDQQRCEALAEDLEHVTVVHGEGTHLDFLKEERVGNADCFVGVTGDDESNIMAAIQAGELGVEQTAVVIHRPDYAGLVEKMGIRLAVSPRVVTARQVMLMIQPGPGRTVDKLGNGQAEVVEITAVEGAAAIGFALSQVRMPPNTLLAVMVRGEKVSVPNAGTVIRPGDTLLAIVSAASREKVVRLFGGE